jgi:hypothetical protein
MLRNALLLSLGGVALLFGAGCSSLTKPDEIRIVDDTPVSVQPQRAPREASPSSPRPAARPGGG